jgi:hypothetical protein
VLQEHYQTILSNSTVALVVALSILTNCMSNQYLAQGYCEHIEHMFMLALPKCYVVLFEVQSNLGYN